MKPEYVEVNNHKYKINTSFKTALECEKIALDESIGEYERSLAIIYKLFYEDGINNIQDHEKLLEMAIKYLKCGNKDIQSSNEEPNMDFEQDMSFIYASFMSDYNIDLDNKDIHWWSFCDLLNGLTESCVLNRVRYIRDYDLSEIKDQKEKKKWIEQKESVALNKRIKEPTEKQKESVNKFYKLTGIKRKE